MRGRMEDGRWQMEDWVSAFQLWVSWSLGRWSCGPGPISHLPSPTSVGNVLKTRRAGPGFHMELFSTHNLQPDGSQPGRRQPRHFSFGISQQPFGIDLRFAPDVFRPLAGYVETAQLFQRALPGPAFEQLQLALPFAEAEFAIRQLQRLALAKFLRAIFPRPLLEQRFALPDIFSQRFHAT